MLTESFIEEVLLHNAEEAPSAGEDVIRRSQSGEKGAFEQLYKTYAGRVYALCLRLTAHPPRAEELTQDVFVRVWESIGTFRGESAFSTWLHRVAVNVVLVDLRTARRRRQRFAQEGEMDSFETGGGPPGPGASVDLEKAVASLPPRARTVFVLHDIEGYRHEEIGEMMNLAVGTTKAQLHRARRLLREVLER